MHGAEKFLWFPFRRRYRRTATAHEKYPETNIERRGKASNTLYAAINEDKALIRWEISFLSFYRQSF